MNRLFVALFLFCFLLPACQKTVIEQSQNKANETLPYSETASSDTLSKTSSTLATSTPLSPTLSTNFDLFSFNGNVSRGKMFEQDLPNGLTFRLVPYQHADYGWFGWVIWIGEKLHPECYNCVVTPPYRGINANDIAGWHFRNNDNSGPNETGEKNVNAPQHERRFCFLLNQADYQVAFDSLNEQLLPSTGERQQIQDKRNLLKPRVGKLEITKLDLGNLVIDERAWIEYMEFTVELDLLKECEFF